MWIRSQDKVCLVDCKRILVVLSASMKYRVINQYRCEENSDDYDILGEYESKERAIEVLNLIENQISYCTQLALIEGFISTLKGQKENTSCVIFEMPEK